MLRVNEEDDLHHGEKSANSSHETLFFVFIFRVSACGGASTVAPLKPHLMLTTRLGGARCLATPPGRTVWWSGTTPDPCGIFLTSAHRFFKGWMTCPCHDTQSGSTRELELAGCSH